VAQQLVAANEEVSFLALIETYELLHHKRLPQKPFVWLRQARGNLSHRLHWNLAEWAKVVAGQKSLAKFIMERRSMSRVSDFVTRPFLKFTEQAQELRAADFEEWLMVDYLASAAKKYKVKTFPGRIHVFRGASSERRGFVDDLMDWRDLAASGVEQTFIEGDHDSIFQPPGVHKMAKKIFSAVAKANSIMGSHGARHQEHEDTGTLQLGSEPKLLMRP
jgi:thioesterase domain-containing protein